ncbi:hypothetical protein ScPMuIL_008654 [Solemya velum]
MREEIVLLLVSAVLVHGLVFTDEAAFCKYFKQDCERSCPSVYSWIRCKSKCLRLYLICRRDLGPARSNNLDQFH